VLLAVKADEADDPVDIGFFRLPGIAAVAHVTTELVQQPGRPRRDRGPDARDLVELSTVHAYSIACSGRPGSAFFSEREAGLILSLCFI